MSSRAPMEAKEVGLLDLPNEILENICRKFVVLEHIWKVEDPRILLQTRWRHQYPDRPADEKSVIDFKRNLKRFKRKVKRLGQFAHESELQDIIVDDDGYPACFKDGRVVQFHENCMAVARMSRRLSDVAMRVFYTENTFAFTAPFAMYSFIRDLELSGRSRAMIRRLSLALREPNTYSRMGYSAGANNAGYYTFFQPVETVPNVDEEAAEWARRQMEDGAPQEVVGAWDGDEEYEDGESDWKLLWEESAELIGAGPQRPFRTPFNCLFPNLQHLELDCVNVVDAFKARESNERGIGIKDIVRLWRRHIRISSVSVTPRRDNWGNRSHTFLRKYADRLEQEMMGLSR